MMKNLKKLLRINNYIKMQKLNFNLKKFILRKKMNNLKNMLKMFQKNFLKTWKLMRNLNVRAWINYKVSDFIWCIKIERFSLRKTLVKLQSQIWATRSIFWEKKMDFKKLLKIFQKKFFKILKSICQIKRLQMNIIKL